ncbi:zinc-ribbon domain-containing protein [bacterium]|nr:zinc-ribbon domain-containing protein [bacterium]MDY3023564.1 zinc-ribbon domain-containing protein [Oliverpabstia sp.]
MKKGKACILERIFVMYCHNCGSELEEGALFCAYCGAEQDISESIQENEQSDKVTEIVPDSHTAARARNCMSAGTKAVIGGLVVIVCVIGVGIWGLKEMTQTVSNDTSKQEAGTVEAVEEADREIKMNSETAAADENNASMELSENYEDLLDISVEELEEIMGEPVKFWEGLNVYVYENPDIKVQAWGNEKEDSDKPGTSAVYFMEEGARTAFGVEESISTDSLIAWLGGEIVYTHVWTEEESEYRGDCIIIGNPGQTEVGIKVPSDITYYLYLDDPNMVQPDTMVEAAINAENGELVKDILMFVSQEATETPFYGVWCAATKDFQGAESIAKELIENGFAAEVINTSEWDGLNPGWFAITAGRYESEEEAKTVRNLVIPFYSDAYVKYSGKKGLSGNR